MISGSDHNLNLRSIAATIFEEPVPADTSGAAEAEARTRSPHERFAVPFMFRPVLSVSNAVAFALRTFLRIFLGSLWFGAWGACALWLWFNIPNPFLRTAAMVPMLVLFLALLAVLMAATSRLTPRQLPR